MFVYKHKESGKFIKFGSHRECKLFDKPYKATLYSTKSGAKSSRRGTDKIWLTGFKDSSTIERELELVEIKFTWEEK